MEVAEFMRHRRHDDANHSEIVKALRAAGRQVIELDGVKHDHPGVPDLLVCWGGGIALLEVKSIRIRSKIGTQEPQQLSAVQEAWHAAYRGPVHSLKVVRSIRDALAATGVQL